MAEIRIGTCSWADDALSKHWYPKALPLASASCIRAAFRHRRGRLDVLPPACRGDGATLGGANAGRLRHAHQGIRTETRHPVKLEALPPDLRDDAPTDDKGRVERPSREFRGEVFRRFLEALEPLRSAGKLGGILFQFPSYVVFKDRSLEYLQWAREQLGNDEMLVEFRHSSWFDDDHRDETLRFLEELARPT